MYNMNRDKTLSRFNCEDISEQVDDDEQPIALLVNDNTTPPPRRAHVKECLFSPKPNDIWHNHDNDVLNFGTVHVVADE